MIETTPKIVKPLSSDELQKDAEAAGVASDQSTKREGDTSLPASESEYVGDDADPGDNPGPAVIPPPD